MLDQQIESISNKLVQFLQDITSDIQRILPNENFQELFRLRSDYAKQLACLFEILINKLIEDYQKNCFIRINLNPVQIWRLIQNLIEQLNNNQQTQELNFIINNIKNLNKYFYNLLIQIQNIECFQIDQICILNKNLIEELNSLSKNLINFYCHLNSSKSNNTYLFQNYSIPQYTNKSSTLGINSNCYPCNNLLSQRPYCPPLNTRIIPTVNVFPCSKFVEEKVPQCSPTPVVYTPEMETLFSSNGIIYARKSGNTWIAENLGRLIETLKDIGQTIDMNEYWEILVRKTGELFVRQKRGRRKRFLQQTLNKSSPQPYQQSDSKTSDDDDL